MPDFLFAAFLFNCSFYVVCALSNMCGSYWCSSLLILGDEKKKRERGRDCLIWPFQIVVYHTFCPTFYFRFCHNQTFITCVYLHLSHVKMCIFLSGNLRRVDIFALQLSFSAPSTHPLFPTKSYLFSSFYFFFALPYFFIYSGIYEASHSTKDSFFVFIYFPC